MFSLCWWYDPFNISACNMTTFLCVPCVEVVHGHSSVCSHFHPQRRWCTCRSWMLDHFLDGCDRLFSLQSLRTLPVDVMGNVYVFSRMKVESSGALWSCVFFIFFFFSISTASLPLSAKRFSGRILSANVSLCTAAGIHHVFFPVFFWVLVVYRSVSRRKGADMQTIAYVWWSLSKVLMRFELRKFGDCRAFAQKP